jgi:hypothetical protein
MKLSSLATDLVKEDQGVWVTYPGTDVEFKIARFGNTLFETKRTQIMRAAKERLKADGLTGELPDDKMRELILPAVSECIILDWKNLDDDNGLPIVCSKEAVVRLFSRRELRDVYAWILNESQKRDNYRAEVVADAVGN